MAWLTDWSYRKSHIVEQEVGCGTNYVVARTVYYGSGTDSGEDVYCNGLCKTDFGDIRFTDNDGDTVLDCWIEEKTDSDYVRIWFQINDDLDAGDVTVYMYYGNAEATTTSDITAPFAFGDEFDGTAEPPSGWSETTVGTKTWADRSLLGSYRVYDFENDSSEWHGNIIYIADPGFTTNWEVRCRININIQDASNNPQFQARVEVYDVNTEKGRIGFNDAWTGATGKITSKVTGTTTDSIQDKASADYKFKITSDGTNYKCSYDIDGGGWTLLSTKAETDAVNKIRFYLAAGASDGVADPRGDLHWVFIRKYNAIEPTAGIWGQREPGIAVGGSLIMVAKVLEIV